MCLFCFLGVSISACSNDEARPKGTTPPTPTKDMVVDLSDATPDIVDIGAQDTPKDTPVDMPRPTGLFLDPNHQSDTNTQLKVFYETYGDRSMFSANHVQAIE